MDKVFIYHYAGKNPHEVKVYHPATLFKAAGITVIPCSGTSLNKLKRLLDEMFAPCVIFTVEIFDETNHEQRTN